MYLGKKYVAKEWLSILLLILSWLLRQYSSAEAIERWYSRGVFLLFRKIWDSSLGLSPIPLYYVFWGIIVFLFLNAIIKIWRQRTWTARCICLSKQLINFSCWLGITFLWFWGFNYGRQKVEDHMRFNPYNMSLTELIQTTEYEAIALDSIRNKITVDTTAISDDFAPDLLETNIRQLLIKSLKHHEYPSSGQPRGRQLSPKGILLRLSTSGVYWPWAGEGNIDAGLHPLKKPPVLAHELAHAYGFGEEGSCSFWAWLAAQQSDDPMLTYSIRLDYWRHLARKWLRTDRKGYLHFYKNKLSPGIRQDIIAIINNNEQYPDIMPKIRNFAYDSYLKSQGVKDGILSYGRVVQLVEGYRRSKHFDKQR